MSEKLAAKGRDIESIGNQLTELGDPLKKSRTYVYSCSRNIFQQIAMPGKQAAQQTEALIEKARLRQPTCFICDAPQAIRSDNGAPFAKQARAFWIESTLGLVGGSWNRSAARSPRPPAGQWRP